MWADKRYHSLDYEMKARYGHKVYKIALDGGFTCPNRDGLIDTRGCIFCSAGGSGDFAASRQLSITDQIEEGKQLLSGKQQVFDVPCYIAYFQAFTGTYDTIQRLRQLYTEAIMHPELVILSIATRPTVFQKTFLICSLSLIRSSLSGSNLACRRSIHRPQPISGVAILCLHMIRQFWHFTKGTLKSLPTLFSDFQAKVRMTCWQLLIILPTSPFRA